MRLLVVEDSDRLRRSLAAGLRRSGYVVDLAADGAAGLSFAKTGQYDVIVLDLMLPRLDGLRLLGELRESGIQTHVLIVSAKDQVRERVEGLEAGADDYLVKPFAFDELCARINALGRRSEGPKSPVIEIGTVAIDEAQRSVSVAGALLPVTPAEYLVLQYLGRRRRRVVSKEELETRIHDFDSDAISNVIEVHISALRRKLRAAGVNELIKTRRGFGYMID